MALSPAIEAGRAGRLPDGFRVPDTSRLAPDGLQNIIIFPDVINAEQFWGLNGRTQEIILLSLLKKNNAGKLNELRPDFDITRPLDMDEIRIANWSDEVTRRDTPITAPRYDFDDTAFAQIHHTTFSIPKDELAGLLERERQRRIEFAPALFAPAEPIGKFTPARRYLAMLQSQIAKGELEKIARGETIYPK